MNETTLEKMKQMKLHGMHGSFKTAIETGRTDDYTLDQFISMITEAEWDNRHNLVFTAPDRLVKRCILSKSREYIYREWQEDERRHNQLD